MCPVYYHPEEIFLTKEAMEFMQEFDKLKKTPEARLLMPEFSFEIEIPDSIVSKINIEGAFKKLENHENLELIEA